MINNNSEIIATSRNSFSSITKRKITNIQNWKIDLSNREVFILTEEEYQKLIASKHQLVIMKNGEMLNKAHIVSARIHKYRNMDYRPEWAKQLEVDSEKKL